MRVCMFHPVDHPLERGWVGRIDGDQVVHLAAQTLQSFFTGGGSAREHAVYPLAEVCLLAPVLHPPAIRVFDSQRSFAFANPAAIVGPRAVVRASAAPLGIQPRLAAMIGAEGEIAGYSALADWRLPGAPPPKDRDFAIGLGPVVATGDSVVPDGLAAAVRIDGDVRLEGAFDGFDWASAVQLAASGTRLYPGDLLAGPALGLVEGIEPGLLELEVVGIGVLEALVADVG